VPFSTTEPHAVEPDDPGRRDRRPVGADLRGEDDPRRAAATVFGVALDGIAEVTRGRADAREMARWTWEFCEGGLRGRP
jgi:hypothetical protein